MILPLLDYLWIPSGLPFYVRWAVHSLKNHSLYVDDIYQR